MPTTVTKTIGVTVRDYATHALWISGCPSNLVTADQIWAGKSDNDATFLVTTTINVNGITTDTTRYVNLDVDTGQGFASAGTPIGAALQSKGVLLTCATYGVITLQCSIGNFKLHNHQVTHTFNKAAYEYASSGTSDSLTENCIFESTERGVRIRYGTQRNCLSIVRTNSGNLGWDFDYYTGGTVANLTVVRPSGFTVGSNGFSSNSAITMKNCCVFGFSNFKGGGGGTFSGSNNATDLASVGFGSANVTSVAFSTATFKVVVDTNHDFRLVSGSALLDVGVADTTTIPAAVDAYGTSRPQGSAWDIGFHELIVAAGTTITLVQATWNWNKQLLIIDAKTFLTLIQKSWLWSVQLIQIGGTTNVTLIQKSWLWSTQLITADGKTFFTLIQKSWLWSTQLLTIDDKTFITLLSKTWQWGTQLLSFNIKTFITLPQKTWFWTGNQLPNLGSTVTPLLMLMGMGV